MAPFLGKELPLEARVRVIRLVVGAWSLEDGVGGREGIAGQTMAQYLGRVFAWHEDNGLGHPLEHHQCAAVLKILEGARRLGPKGRGPREPLTGDLIGRALATPGLAGVSRGRAAGRCAIGVAFFGLFRQGDLMCKVAEKFDPAVNLRCGDVRSCRMGRGSGSSS